MLDTGSDARMTAILGLPVGWLWGFGFLFILLLVRVFFFFVPPQKKKDHSNKLKVGERCQLLFLVFSSGVTI